MLQIKVFDVFDGAQPGRAPFVSAAKSPDGRLWFADGMVLQMVDPNHLGGNLIPPPVHVEGIDCRPTELSGTRRHFLASAHTRCRS